MPLEVGPGKYDPAFISTNSMNSSNGFASKTLRVWDQRKGAISNQFIVESFKKKSLSQFGEAFDEEKYFEFIDVKVLARIMSLDLGIITMRVRLLRSNSHNIKRITSFLVLLPFVFLVKRRKISKVLVNIILKVKKM